MIIYEEFGPWGGNSYWTGTALTFPHRWPKQELNINPRDALAPNQ